MRVIKSAPPSLLVSFDACYEKKLMFVFIHNVIFYYHNNHDLYPFSVFLPLCLFISATFSDSIFFLISKLGFSTSSHDLFAFRFQYLRFVHLFVCCVLGKYSIFRHSSELSLYWSFFLHRNISLYTFFRRRNLNLAADFNY